VSLVRIEKDLLAYGWLPEQIRAHGLSINLGEEVAWPINGDFVAIKIAKETVGDSFASPHDKETLLPITILRF
jgi:hypothetical protein